MNVGLGGDDLELETDKKGETSVGPRQAVVQVSIFLPKMDSRHVYRHIAFDIAFNAQTVCILKIPDHTWTPWQLSHPPRPLHILLHTLGTSPPVQRENITLKPTDISKLHNIGRLIQIIFGHLVTVGGHTHTKSKSPQSRVCQRKIICLEILLLHLPHKIVVVGACEHCKHDRLYDYMMIIWLNKSVTCNFKGDGKSVPSRNQVASDFPNLILLFATPIFIVLKYTLLTTPSPHTLN